MENRRVSACDPSDETLERFKSHCQQTASLPIDLMRNWLHAIPADRQSDFALTACQFILRHHGTRNGLICAKITLPNTDATSRCFDA